MSSVTLFSRVVECQQQSLVMGAGGTGTLVCLVARGSASNASSSEDGVAAGPIGVVLQPHGRCALAPGTRGVRAAGRQGADEWGQGVDEWE